MSKDLDVLRAQLRTTLQRYWQHRIALDIAQDQADQTAAELREVLDRFLKAGGTQDEVDTEVERVEQEF